MTPSGTLGSRSAPGEDTEYGADSGNGAHALDDSRFWRWMAVGMGVLAVCKGIRQPNLWSFTQAQFDYSNGFMRRGLFGFVLARPLGLGRYEHFAVLSTELLLVLFAALVLLARTAKLAEWTAPGELLAVYASSYSVTYLAHLNGYLDIPLALLCVAQLFVRSTVWRLAAAVVCAILGILIHEQFLFCFLPVLAVSVLFGAAVEGQRSQQRLAWFGGVALIAMGLAMMWFLGRHGSISETQASRLSRSIAQRADRPLVGGGGPSVAAHAEREP